MFFLKDFGFKNFDEQQMHELSETLNIFVINISQNYLYCDLCHTQSALLHHMLFQLLQLKRGDKWKNNTRKCVTKVCGLQCFCTDLVNSQKLWMKPFFQKIFPYLVFG